MNDNDKEVLLEVTPLAEKLPDEAPGIYIEDRIKIFDPDSGSVLFEGRA